MINIDSSFKINVLGLGKQMILLIAKTSNSQINELN